MKLVILILALLLSSSTAFAGCGEGRKAGDTWYEYEDRLYYRVKFEAPTGAWGQGESNSYLKASNIAEKYCKMYNSGYNHDWTTNCVYSSSDTFYKTKKVKYRCKRKSD